MIQCICHHAYQEPWGSRSLSRPQHTWIRKIGSQIVPSPNLTLSGCIIVSDIQYSSWKGQVCNLDTSCVPRFLRERACSRLGLQCTGRCWCSGVPAWFWPRSGPINDTFHHSQPLPWLLQPWEQKNLKDVHTCTGPGCFPRSSKAPQTRTCIRIIC